MRVACPHCQAAYNVDDQRIPAAGLNVRCPKCQNVFPIRKPAPSVAGAAVPLPMPERSTAVAAPPAASFGGTPATHPSIPALSVPLPPPRTAPAVSTTKAPQKQEPRQDSIPQDAAIALPPPERAARASVSSSVPLPQPDQDPLPAAPEPQLEAPVFQPPAFGEVSFDASPQPDAAPESHAGSPADPSAASGEDPFAAPPPADPFFTPPPIAPPRHPVPVTPLASGSGAAQPGGPVSIEPAESQELEALFGESSEPRADKPAPAPEPSSGPYLGGRYKVRRRSGKIFGPFDEHQIVEMLGKGELLGNEDVSADGGQSWAPAGSVPAFADAMRSLMDTPAETPEPAARAGPYVSRMAESKVVAGAVSRWREILRRWLPVAAGAVALVLVLGVGLGAGLTRHGVFFHKALRGRGSNRPAAMVLPQARAAIADDNFGSTRRALELAEQALRLDGDDPQAKGLYVQAVASLMRHGGAAATATSRAESYEKELAAHDAKEPDTVKARAALALATGSGVPPGVVPSLEKLARKHPPDEEALWLLGQAAAVRKDWKDAGRWYDALRTARPAAARGAHGLAAALAAQGDVAGARNLYEKALSQDPKHLSSGLELAFLAEKVGDATAAEAALRAALGPDAAALSPIERARARLLLAGLLARRPGADGQSRLGDAERTFEEAVAEDPGYLPSRLAYARFLMRRGASDRAVGALQPAAATSGSDAEFAALYGRALAATGRVLDALNVVEGALAKSPSSARLLFAKGFVAEQRGKRDEARSLYERAAAADKADWEPHLALGNMALHGGELERAESELKLAAQKGPQEPEPHVGLGDWRLARGDSLGAEAEYREALALDPDHAGGHLGLARVLAARGAAAAARTELEKALKLDPRLAGAQVVLGELLWRAKDLEGARKAFQAAVSLEPQGVVARTRLGAVELELGQMDAAVTDLLAASNLDLSLADGHFWLGRALLAKGETNQAVEQFKRACELRPDSATYHLYFGMAQERANAPAEAADEYKLAIAKDPKSVDAYERLGQLYAVQNRCDEAVLQFEKALKVAPAVQRLRVALGECKQTMGKQSEAIAIYRQVLKAEPSQVGLYYKIGRAVHESSGARQALPWYERASREEPANPMPHYYLGFSYKERGLKAKAVHEFRAYLKAKPDADDRKDVEREIEDLGG
jgi:predicted Zn finger-like uncharacterized protein